MNERRSLAQHLGRWLALAQHLGRWLVMTAIVIGAAMATHWCVARILP